MNKYEIISMIWAMCPRSIEYWTGKKMEPVQAHKWKAGFVYAIQSGKLSFCGGSFDNLVKEYNETEGKQA